MILFSESLKMPFLNTSFESEAPMMNCAWHLLRRFEDGDCDVHAVWLFVTFAFSGI